MVRSLHARGRYVICYVEVGAAEDFRPDYHRWPAAVLGAGNGWQAAALVGDFDFAVNEE